MSLTDAFYEAVSSGNVRRVHIMMKDSMLVDLTFSEFDAMIKAARDLSGLYDTHDGHELDNNKSMWNDSYMDKLMVQVVGNFSHERVDHLKKVVRYLRPVAIPSSGVPSNCRSLWEDKKSSGQPHKDGTGYSKPNNSSRGAKIAGGAIIGAVAGGAIAAAGTTVMSGVVIGAVAGAVAVKFVTNRK